MATGSSPRGWYILLMPIGANPNGAETSKMLIKMIMIDGMILLLWPKMVVVVSRRFVSTSCRGIIL